MSTPTSGQWLTPPPLVVHLDARKVSAAVGRRVLRQAIFVNDLGWRWKDGRELWVVRGHPMDGGSIPGLGRFFGLDPFEGAALRGCGAHDAYYTFQDRPSIIYGRRREVAADGTYKLVPDPKHPAPKRLHRSEADKLLREGLQVDGSKDANLYYRAVRLGGGFSWRSADSPLVGGYTWAVMTGTCDEWVEHIIKLYGPGDSSSFNVTPKDTLQRMQAPPVVVGPPA